MLPVQKPAKTYNTLEKICQRKEELLEELQKDNDRFSVLWNKVFVSKKSSTKGEFLTSVVTNSITAVDVFIMVRKLLKNYRGLFARKR